MANRFTRSSKKERRAVTIALLEDTVTGVILEKPNAYNQSDPQNCIIGKLVIELMGVYPKFCNYTSNSPSVSGMLEDGTLTEVTGLGYKQLCKLYYTSRWPRKFDSEYDFTNSNKRRAKIGAKVIKHRVKKLKKKYKLN